VSPFTIAAVRAEPDAAALASAGITRPDAGEAVGDSTFVVRGWALGAEDRVLAVEIRADDRLVRVVAVREPSPDIAAAYPDRSAAAHCGFLTRVHAAAVDPAAGLRLDAVLAQGTRAAIGTIGLANAETPAEGPRGAPATPTIRPDVEQLVRDTAARAGLDPAEALARPRVETLDGTDLAGRTVLDVSGGPGHVARAARARGAARVDSVHRDDDLAGLARLLDLYHRTTRVFVHESLEALERTYDVVLALGAPPPVEPARLEALGAGIVVRP
jgi:hypothetical protein